MGRKEEHADGLDSLNTSKLAFYDSLAAQLRSVLDGEPDFLADAANMASVLYHSLPHVNWVGFYLWKQEQLVLGPFQGKPACTRIPRGKGVCGTAVARRTTVVVPNVHDFPGHIACDSASQSEIVVPILVGERLIGVLDIDSPLVGRFDEDDRRGVKSLVEIFLTATRKSLLETGCICD